MLRGLWFFAATAASAALVCGPLVASANAQKPPDTSLVVDSAAYLLVIDHSASMVEKDQPGGKMRWEAMLGQAKEFLKTVPLESMVWIAIFANGKPEVAEPPLATEQQRAAAIEWLEKHYTAPSPDAQTWLYETLALALQKADRLTEQNAGRYISVLVYTDGEDNRSPTWTKEKLRETFNDLEKKDENLWIFASPIGSKGVVLKEVFGDKVQPVEFYRTILDFALTPGAARLNNAVLAPRQSFEMEFAASEETWRKVSGRPLSLEFVPDAGQPIRVRAPEVVFRPQPIRVDLEVLNAKELAADRPYSGKLKIRYPEFSKHVVRAAPFVQVSFQEGKPPKVYGWIPEPNSRFPAGQPVQFKVTTVQGADVTWDFGDGETASGADVRHAYNTAGKRQVRLSVVGDPRLGTTKQEFAIDVVDVGVSIDPYQGPIVAGVPFTFTCSPRGRIERYEWLAGGNTFEGQPRQDPAAPGSRLTYTFEQPGPQELSVVGFAEGVKPTSALAVDVAPPPAIEVVGGSPRPFGEPVTFKLHSPEGWTSVAWDFGDGRTDATSNVAPVHEYGLRGDLWVKAEIAWKNGHTTVLREPLHMRAEPPVAAAEAWHDGEPVARVTVPATLELKDLSKGTVVRATWTHDGAALEPGQASVVVETPGRHTVVLTVEGPPDRLGATVSGTSSYEYVAVPRPNHYVFGAAAGGALLAVILAGWILLARNGPRRWELYYSNQGRPDEATDRRVKVSRYWSWWRKYAVIPMKHFCGECEYWGSGQGSNDSVRVEMPGSGSAWQGSARYSGDRNPRVATSPPESDGRAVDYRWRDNRCPDDQYKTIFLRLVKKIDDSVWPYLAFAGVMAVLVALLWLVYRAIYFAGY